jgi:hypothetical protein
MSDLYEDDVRIRKSMHIFVPPAPWVSCLQKAPRATNNKGGGGGLHTLCTANVEATCVKNKTNLQNAWIS